MGKQYKLSLTEKELDYIDYLNRVHGGTEVDTLEGFETPREAAETYKTVARIQKKLDKFYADRK